METERGENAAETATPSAGGSARGYGGTERRMPRMKTRRRKRIGKGIYRDQYGLSAAVKVGTGDQPSRGRSDSRSTRRCATYGRGRTRPALNFGTRPGGRAPPRAVRFWRTPAYLAQVKHLASFKSRVCEVDAWTALYGRLRRVQGELTSPATFGWSGRARAGLHGPFVLNAEMGVRGRRLSRRTPGGISTAAITPRRFMRRAGRRTFARIRRGTRWRWSWGSGAST